MKKTISAAVYERNGIPAEVLRVEEQPWPVPGPDQALVQMRAAPINPADLNMLEGKYPTRVELPATPGMEGAGTVLEVGRHVTKVKPGDLVLLPHGIGTWREALVVAADRLIVVPPEIDPVQAGMLKINPLTAWRMLHGFVPLKPGDWLIQNAANSAAGRAVVQIAQALGFRTVNIVRRPELVQELEEEGGTVVLLDAEELREQIRDATAGQPIALGLNAVGGESALHLANALAPDAILVTYGAMSLQPLRIPNGLLIFKNINFRGFWINKWYDQATPAERMEAFTPLFQLTQGGLLKTKVEKCYPLAKAREAVSHAAQEKRSGKIVFDFQS